MNRPKRKTNDSKTKANFPQYQPHRKYSSSFGILALPFLVKRLSSQATQTIAQATNASSFTCCQFVSVFLTTISGDENAIDFAVGLRRYPKLGLRFRAKST